MSNCIIAQSGGPSSVINATVAGIVKANQLNPLYEHVYGGLNGIEGILQERFVDLTNMSDLENRLLQQTPSCALGSCRYKLKRDNEADFQKIISIMDHYQIETMFYIGGNDSMDTVAALSEYTASHQIANHRFVGCPKTVDNDLVETDHCPGFGSAAKFIAATALQCWYDINAYPSSRTEVFILETMGRDAGWLAASACLSNKVDILIVPEEPFNKEHFLSRVKDVIALRSKCFVAVSEGARYIDGTYLSCGEARSELFGHTVLGGAGRALEQMILDAGIASRCKVQDLSIAQRCHATEQSLTDVTESFQLGMSAHMHTADPSFTGRMVGLKRLPTEQYAVSCFDVDAEKVANFVKNFPSQWLLPDYGGISEEARQYMLPLIKGTPEIIYDETGLPAYIKPYYLVR
ncbi:diphosphate--fructose-6-phosphate 1-phosphotransferase [Lactimicrobium massiliense]|uniref:diphosphate--fructose-6-phosphate 1-phosphotransferase n=1 Tax=Lactimicrobium massiliense TaxID=2161814 RepID=UPI000D55E921|nr:diphosphate--fructose-6-phosphate 1-phosphotransferase [Lactimicrobium massiliense]